MALAAGDKLGPYEILAPIGAGGMGEVYRARDTKLDREVAIKVLPSALAQSQQRLARFDREAKVLAALNHPNIATIYGVEDRALVMELVEGPTLADRLSGPMPFTESLRIAGQIAEALEAAHEKGVVHRDLKPANIKVRHDGAVKVLDFGLATVLQSSSPEAGASVNSPTLTMAATEAGVILGTAAYMAPEQAAGASVDRRADIWSFGVVLWEMLTGKRLFDADTMAHTLADVLRAPIDFGKLPATTPVPIRGLLRRCLDRDTRSRLQWIGEARVTIQAYLANPDGEQPVPADGTVRRLHWLAWVMAAAASMAALAAGYVAYQHIKEEPRSVARFSFTAPDNGMFSPLVPPAVSPDGRKIVYAADVGGKTVLLIRNVDSLTARELVQTADNRPHPFWSPDSRFLAFFDSDVLKKIDVSGGPAITVCGLSGAVGRGGSWSTKDVILFSSNTLWRVPAAGGTPSPATELDAASDDNVHRYPWFLPDGHRFLFTVRSNNRNASAVYLADLNSKGRRQVVRAASNAVYVSPGYLLYVRERTLMSQPFDAAKGQTTGEAVPIAEHVNWDLNNVVGEFSASDNGLLAYSTSIGETEMQLSWFDRSGKLLDAVKGIGDVQWATLSPDESMVATDRLDPRSGGRDIWLRDLARGTDTRLTFSGNNVFPTWSPDGARVAFMVGGDKHSMVWKAANGNGPIQTFENTLKRPTDWSSDGRYLIAESVDGRPKTFNDIWVYPQFGDKKPFQYVATEFREQLGKLSPDGHWLAYQSDESKRPDIYVVSFPTPSGKWQISNSGGVLPVWSRDGRELFFIGPVGVGTPKMNAVEIKTAEGKLVAGIAKQLFDIRLSSPNPNYSVSRDGRFLIPTGGDFARSAAVPMTVVLNWTAMLKK